MTFHRIFIFLFGAYTALTAERLDTGDYGVAGFYAFIAAVQFICAYTSRNDE